MILSFGIEQSTRLWSKMSPLCLQIYVHRYRGNTSRDSPRYCRCQKIHPNDRNQWVWMAQEWFGIPEGTFLKWIYFQVALQPPLCYLYRNIEKLLSEKTRDSIFSGNRICDNSEINHPIVTYITAYCLTTFREMPKWKVLKLKLEHMCFFKLKSSVTFSY